MEGKERIQTHSSHHHLHSRFLKSSHISVTIATLLCLPLFHSCFFSLKKKKKIHHSLSYSPSLVNITETPRLALHLLAEGGEGGRGAAQISEGGGEKAWLGELPDGQACRKRREGRRPDEGPKALIPEIWGLGRRVHKGKGDSSVFSSNSNVHVWQTET